MNDTKVIDKSDMKFTDKRCKQERGDSYPKCTVCIANEFICTLHEFWIGRFGVKLIVLYCVTSFDFIFH